MSTTSERVKSCDLHPSQPWVLSALYTGHLFIWNYLTGTVVKSIEACDQPIRCAKFIARKQWVICGSDDMMIRVFNINTLEKIATFEAHVDYIRCIDVHPTQPYVLSSSDDMQIKMWNWEDKWNCQQVFEGHQHYVMQIKWNPKDSNTFASASLDRTVKVWSIGSPLPNYSLEGHEKGVNSIDFYPGGDKPYVISGADDRSLKIWDYQTKSCVQTLEGHTANVCAVGYHPKLPIILSGSEDGTVRIWHSTTYRLETTLNYGLERCWSLAVTPHSNKVAVGYDEGTIVIGLGQEEPVCSMDASGKLLMTSGNNNDIVSCSLRGVGASGVQDGDRIDVQTKDLGNCELFPQKIIHNSNGRFVAVCGDGEYIIYTATALRNKSFGSALDFAWSSEGTGDYAVRETTSRLRVFKNFKETQVFKPPFSCEGLHGGNLICMTCSEFVVFVDWTDCRLVMRIDVKGPRDVFWSQDGEHVVLACEDSFYVLKCEQDLINEMLATGQAHPEDGIEGAFTLLDEVGESVESGQWVGGCFLYTNSASRLNYYVGGEVLTLSHLDRQLFLLGFVAKENRVFLMDKNQHITSYSLLESVLQYQTAVVRRDFDLADELLGTIPREKYNDIARFLESQGFKDTALMVADDPDQKFDLALQLEKLDVALEIMNNEIVPNAAPDDADVQSRWKQLGDLALSGGKLALAEECANKASDLAGLLLMHTCSGNVAGVRDIIAKANESGRANIAFVGSLLLNDKRACVEILHKAGRDAESAFFARTYAPSLTTECVARWKEALKENNPKAASALADPVEHAELFADFQEAIAVQQAVDAATEGKTCPAVAYPEMAGNLNAVLLDVVREHGPEAISHMYQHYGGAGGAGMAAAQQAQAAAEAERQAQAAAEAERQAQAAAEAERQAAQAAAEAERQAQAAAAAEAEQQAAAAAEAEQQAQAAAAAEAERQAQEQAAAAAAAAAEEERRRKEQEELLRQQRIQQEELAAAAAAAEQDVDDELEDDDDLGGDLDDEMDDFDDWA